MVQVAFRESNEKLRIKRTKKSIGKRLKTNQKRRRGDAGAPSVSFDCFSIFHDHCMLVSERLECTAFCEICLAFVTAYPSMSGTAQGTRLLRWLTFNESGGTAAALVRLRVCRHYLTSFAGHDAVIKQMRTQSSSASRKW